MIEGELIPDYDVFVSYSSKDEAAANQVLHSLEEDKVRCWIAPRDIKGGANWSASIIDAIENCRAMVLIYSSHSNLSQQVLREVERAVAKQVVIIPFRIDDVPMTQEMEYYLSTSHWLDAINGSDEKVLTQLTQSVKSLVEAGKSSTGPKLSSSAFLSAVTVNSKKSLWIAGVSGLVLLVGLALVFLAGQLFSNSDEVVNDAGTNVPEDADVPLFDPQFKRNPTQLEELVYENISRDPTVRLSVKSFADLQTEYSTAYIFTQNVTIADHHL